VSVQILLMTLIQNHSPTAVTNPSQSQVVMQSVSKYIYKANPLLCCLFALLFLLWLNL